jgi:hypothetical protein
VPGQSEKGRVIIHTPLFLLPREKAHKKEAGGEFYCRQSTKIYNSGANVNYYSQSNMQTLANQSAE